MEDQREDPTQTYVTYRQLVGYTLSSLVFMLTLFALYASHMNSKVSKELYDAQRSALCDQMDRIEVVTKSNQTQIIRQGKNQLLVLRHLRIQPVDPD
jgi:hypothetical protein